MTTAERAPLGALDRENDKVLRSANEISKLASASLAKPEFGMRAPQGPRTESGFQSKTSCRLRVPQRRLQTLQRLNGVRSGHRLGSTEVEGLAPERTSRLTFFGAAERNRTPDLLITNQLLYQLSYSSQARHYKRPGGSRAIRNEPPQRARSPTGSPTGSVTKPFRQGEAHMLLQSIEHLHFASAQFAKP